MLNGLAALLFERHGDTCQLDKTDDLRILKSVNFQADEHRRFVLVRREGAKPEPVGPEPAGDNPSINDWRQT